MFSVANVKPRYFEFQQPGGDNVLKIEPPKLKTLRELEEAGNDDRKLIEAAQDLGAPTHLVFRRVIFPLSIPGVISGITMVFVPSVSTFVISQMLGSGKNLLVGDLIDLQFMGGAYNPHLGSAIALVMTILIFICMWIMNKFDDGSSEEGGLLL